MSYAKLMVTNWYTEMSTLSLTYRFECSATVHNVPSDSYDSIWMHTMIRIKWMRHRMRCAYSSFYMFVHSSLHSSMFLFLFHWKCQSFHTSHNQRRFSRHSVDSHFTIRLNWSSVNFLFTTQTQNYKYILRIYARRGGGADGNKTFNLQTINNQTNRTS